MSGVSWHIHVQKSPNLPDSVYYDLNLQDTLAIQKADALGKSILGIANN